jgi:HEPN domain-containing protein
MKISIGYLVKLPIYLKALLVALTDPHLYTHDLGELLDSIKI